VGHARVTADNFERKPRPKFLIRAAVGRFDVCTDNAEDRSSRRRSYRATRRSGDQSLLPRKGPERCWFCAWEGVGFLHFDGVRERVRLPSRDYLLYTGPIELATTPLDDVWVNSPHLWWPADRAWIVATEIDFAWTYVGGASSLVGELLDDPRIESQISRSPSGNGSSLRTARPAQRHLHDRIPDLSARLQVSHLRTFHASPRHGDPGHPLRPSQPAGCEGRATPGRWPLLC
jgi:hypothetical protein